MNHVSLIQAGVHYGGRLLEGISHLVYPPFCLLCEEELRTSERIVCDRCWGLFDWIDYPFCQICGAPLKRGDRTCRHCSDDDFVFSANRSPYVYAGPLRTLIHALKFNRRKSLAARLGRRMAFAVLNDERYVSADCIIPVPLHAGRLRERGYNQSEWLAGEISGQLDIPVSPDMLERTKRTKVMTALDPARRYRNVAGAFRASAGQAMKGKRVILVDDVFTTGATAEACSRALLEAGSEEVLVLTAARALSVS